MGKWSGQNYDNVLCWKMKSLVSGAIERAKLEKTDSPLISYERFVEDFDARDSFTTTLVDILVQEYADKRTRPSSADRHFIAQRTVTRLRAISTSRPGRLRRSQVDPAQPTIIVREEEPYELQAYDADHDVEGVRLPTDIYDAYSSSWNPIIFSNRRAASSSPTPTPESRESPIRVPTPPRTHSPTFIHIPLSRSPAPLPSPPIIPPRSISRIFPNPQASISGANLSRTHSIRRTHHRSSRTSDFTDYTARRRSSTRERLNAQRASLDDSDLPHSLPDRSVPMSVRRFFPSRYSNGGSGSRPHSPLMTDRLENPEDEGSRSIHLGEPTPSSAPTWLPILPSSSVPWTTGSWAVIDNSVDAELEERERQRELSVRDRERSTVPFPRLRRGGLPAPESLSTLNLRSSTLAAEAANSPGASTSRSESSGSSVSLHQDHGPVFNPASPVSSDSSEGTTIQSHQLISAYPTPTPEAEIES